MYSAFFGFREKPFNVVPDPSFLYPSARHRMALTYLEYGLSENIGFILLSGEIGTGKTTLVRYLTSRLKKNMDTAVIFNTNVTADQLIKQILRELEIKVCEEDKTENLDRLNDYLITRYSRNRRVLLIIDEAQNLDMASLEEVRMLSNLQTRRESLLQIMLVGQPELRIKIKDPALAQLAQRIAVSYHLAPMTRQETAEYISHRLKNAGCGNPDLFTAEAVDLIHEKSRGIPRSINILCDAALVYAYADSAGQVSLDIVKQTVLDREEQGVIPEGAVWQENQTLNQSGSGLQESELVRRISHLEERMADLSARLDCRTRETQEVIETERDRLVMKLTQLLDQERRKSDRFLYQCSRYRTRIQEMEEVLACPEESRNIPDKAPCKPGFLKKIFCSG